MGKFKEMATESDALVNWSPGTLDFLAMQTSEAGRLTKELSERLTYIHFKMKFHKETFTLDEVERLMEIVSEIEEILT